MVKNKNVVCDKCMRVMRQDNLKRHMRQHEEEKFEQSIFSSNTSLNKDYETGSEFSSISSYGAWKSSLNRENIIKTLEIDAAEYKRKLELGRILYEEAKEREIPEESLRREYTRPGKNSSPTGNLVFPSKTYCETREFFN